MLSLRVSLALSLLASGLVANDVTPQPATYRAGIVEFSPPPRAQTELETILNNAKLYRKYAAEAAEMGVQILVFSEYGLVTFYDLDTRESVAGYLQDVPDPKVVEWNPCQEPDRFNNTQVLHELSCAARDNSLVIVANLLSREPCDSENHLEMTNSSCPQNGYYHFNTNVFFASNGTLIARYHKRHLFTEESYADPVPKPEYVIVDLGFVRIATVVCFDILWYEPFIELIEIHGVRNLAYPTAWVNELPFHTGPQEFASIAYGLGINILAANYFNPSTGSLGSGIFSSTRGMLNGTWDISTPGRLVIADVPVNPANMTDDDEPVTCDIPTNLEEDFTTKLVEAPSIIFTDQPSTNDANKTHQIMYEQFRNYTYADMNEMEGNITQLCQGSLCCDLSYKFVTRGVNETYKFVVRSGVQTIPGGYKMGFQICSVLRCESDDDIETCGRLPDPEQTSESSFDRLILSGRFQTKYLYPSMTSTKLELVSPERWIFEKHECGGHDNVNGVNIYTAGTLSLTAAVQSSLLEATIKGRVYEWDEE